MPVPHATDSDTFHKPALPASAISNRSLKPKSKHKAAVSTSAMFKTAQQIASKRKSDPSPPKSSKPQPPKKKHRPLDPIAGHLNDSLNETASHLLAQTKSQLETTHSHLLQTLVDASVTAETQFQTRETTTKLLDSSLGDEILRFRDKEGRDTGQAKLGARMEAFEARVEKLDGELRGLLGELGDVEGQIEGCWGELEGMWLGGGEARETAAGETKGEGGAGGEEKEKAGVKGKVALDPEQAAMRAYWEGKVRELMESKMKEVKASEEEYRAREKRRSEGLAKALEPSQ
ncbi:MAG: hypothetical protein MMC23_004234 [Stictis urceolatum]|nr:hypothetical protein [Stictis urceolata]